MSLYALVNNGVIERINITLPYSISNTDVGVNEENPQQYGLYPIVGDEPVHDAQTQVLAGPAYELDGQSVRRVYTVTAKPAAPIPQSVSMRQARLALLDAGLLDDVEALMSSMPRAAQIEWEFASEVQRNSQLVEAVKTSAHMDDEMIDSLFIKAATL